MPNQGRCTHAQYIPTDYEIIYCDCELNSLFSHLLLGNLKKKTNRTEAVLEVGTKLSTAPLDGVLAVMSVCIGDGKCMGGVDYSNYYYPTLLMGCSSRNKNGTPLLRDA